MLSGTSPLSIAGQTDNGKLQTRIQAVTKKVATAFWGIRPCILRDVHDYFGGTSVNIYESTQRHTVEDNKFKDLINRNNNNNIL